MADVNILKLIFDESNKNDLYNRRHHRKAQRLLITLHYIKGFMPEIPKKK